MDLLGRIGVPLLALGLLSACSGDFNFKAPNFFAKPDWAVFSTDDNKSLNPTQPIAAEDLVAAGGGCAGAAAPTVSTVTTPAGDLGNAPPQAAPVVGGVALGMSECEVVRRAGQPEKVEIGAGEGGRRTVVLTYLRGSWPGIYRFADGRLNEIERVAEPPAPPTPQRKKPAKPRTTAKQST